MTATALRLAPILALLLAAGCAQPPGATRDGTEPPAPESPGADRNTRFGLPGPASDDPAYR